jgi:hypothetical protein
MSRCQYFHCLGCATAHTGGKTTVTFLYSVDVDGAAEGACGKLLAETVASTGIDSDIVVISEEQDALAVVVRHCY